MIQSQPAKSATNGSLQRPGKVMVIGLDGATFDLIKPWVAEGHLPTLSRLLETGSHGQLHSTIPPMTAPAWTSFATGTNPGQHRLYDWVAREPDSYKFTPVTALDATRPTLFSVLSQVGRRVCAFNVPMTYPPTQVNGVMISGMPAPSTQNTITYPEALFDEIVEQVGDYILYPDPGGAYSESGIDSFLTRLYRCTDLRLQTLDYLRQKEDWDFNMVVFNGTDTVSHAMWKYMDPAHPLHDPRPSPKSAQYAHAIRDYYAYLDHRLAPLIDSLDDDTTLIVMSDHGFGPFHKFIHVNNWLIQQGFMQVRRAVRSQLKHQLLKVGFAPMTVYNQLMKLGLGVLKRGVVRGNGQGLLKTLFLSFEDVDWARTVAYSLGNVGQITLNVAGREPQGCVQPGEEYERVRTQIMEQLQTLQDPQTGEPVVETIHRREEIYHGNQLEHAPDILFIPRRLEYFGFGEYEFGSHQIIEPMARGISGTHRLNGIFMAAGPGIKPGHAIDGARITDLAPTILHAMGVPIPDFMDGRILNEIFHPGYPKIIPNETDVPWSETGNSHLNKPDEEPLTEAEKALLAERLRGLGYVG